MLEFEQIESRRVILCRIGPIYEFTYALLGHKNS
jgi:hypothetical protein